MTKFSTEEAAEIARLLLAVAACDGGFVQNERDFITRFSTAHKLPDPTGSLEASFDEEMAFADTSRDPAAAAVEGVQRRVTDPKKRREVIKICLQLALADRDYALEENLLIKRVADAL